MGIVRFALRFPHTFYVLAGLIVFLGITSIRAMPTDIFPQINIPVVTVIWSYTGLSTPEMERLYSGVMMIKPSAPPTRSEVKTISRWRQAVIRKRIRLDMGQDPVM